MYAVLDDTHLVTSCGAAEATGAVVFAARTANPRAAAASRQVRIMASSVACNGVGASSRAHHDACAFMLAPISLNESYTRNDQPTSFLVIISILSVFPIPHLGLACYRYPVAASGCPKQDTMMAHHLVLVAASLVAAAAQPSLVAKGDDLYIVVAPGKAAKIAKGPESSRIATAAHLEAMRLRLTDQIEALASSVAEETEANEKATTAKLDTIEKVCAAPARCAWTRCWLAAHNARTWTRTLTPTHTACVRQAANALQFGNAIGPGDDLAATIKSLKASGQTAQPPPTQGARGGLAAASCGAVHRYSFARILG